MLFTQYLPYTGYLPTIYMLFMDHHSWIVPRKRVSQIAMRDAGVRAKRKVPQLCPFPQKR